MASWRPPDSKELWRNADEGDGLVLASHGAWVVVGIPIGDGGAMIHIPPDVAREAALSLLRSADQSDGAPEH